MHGQIFIVDPSAVWASELFESGKHSLLVNSNNNREKNITDKKLCVNLIHCHKNNEDIIKLLVLNTLLSSKNFIDVKGFWPPTDKVSL